MNDDWKERLYLFDKVLIAASVFLLLLDVAGIAVVVYLIIHYSLLDAS